MVIILSNSEIWSLFLIFPLISNRQANLEELASMLGTTDNDDIDGIDTWLGLPMAQTVLLTYEGIDANARTWLPIVRALREGNCNFPLPVDWDGKIYTRMQQTPPAIAFPEISEEDQEPDVVIEYAQGNYLLILIQHQY